MVRSGSSTMDGLQDAKIVFVSIEGHLHTVAFLLLSDPQSQKSSKDCDDGSCACLRSSARFKQGDVPPVLSSTKL